MTVILKDNGTTGQHGHRRAVVRATVVCPVVLTTEWATTRQKTIQHGLTSIPFSCCWALVSYVDATSV